MNRKFKLTRRNVVLGLAGAGAAAAVAAAATRDLLGGMVGQSAGTTTTTTGGAVSLAQAEYEQWLAAVGSTFTAAGGYRLKLNGVRAVGSTVNRDDVDGVRTRAFVALFDVVGSAAMPSDLIYAVARSTDRFDLYMSAGAARQRMIAVVG